MKLDVNALLNYEIQNSIGWNDFPDEHNYESAYDYLSLLNLPQKAQQITERLRDAELVLFKRPDDILRAAGLNAAPQTELRVQNTIRKIRSNTNVAPILLVNSRRQDRIHIADGYHRVSAAYYLAAGQRVPCIMTAWEMD